MKLEVEIDLTDEQWAGLRPFACTGTGRGWVAGMAIKALIDAYDLKPPLRVGDRVMIVNGMGSPGEVLATDGDQAWVKFDFDLCLTHFLTQQKI